MILGGLVTVGFVALGIAGARTNRAGRQAQTASPVQPLPDARVVPQNARHDKPPSQP